MTNRNNAGVFLTLAVIGAAYSLWYFPDAFPRNVRAVLDERRLSLLLGGNVRIYTDCYSTEFRGDECARWRMPASHNPEFWPNPKAPPMKWPAPPTESAYRPGMDRIEYFNALCAAEAGEFITKTVKAEGIYMIRPRKEESDETIRSRYGLEDPYGYGQGDVGDEGPYTFPGPIKVYGSMPPHYQWVETAVVKVGIHWTQKKYYSSALFDTPPKGTTIRRYEVPQDLEKWPDGVDTFKNHVIVRYDVVPKSRYGYTWRGIRRPYDREFGIAGGELAVVDLETSEILGYRRGFMLASNLAGGGLSWLTGRACPFYSRMPPEASRGRRYDKDVDYTRMFVTRVVIPEFKDVTERGTK